MGKKLFLFVMVLAIVGAITIAEEKKFENIKECMMCLKTNRGNAMEAAEAGDMEKLASATTAIKDASMCMKKDFCTGEKFADCCKMFMESVEKLEKAAKDKDADAAKEAVKAVKDGCMCCHKECKKE